MGKWTYYGNHGRAQGWIYVESCGCCGGVLKRRDWHSDDCWTEVATIAGSPYNTYFEDLLYDHYGVTMVCRCRGCGGNARLSGREQGPGLGNSYVVQR